MILLALFGPALSGYRFDQQNLEYPNLPPRIPVLENIGIFDGTQVLKKTTGTEVSNPYREAAIKEYHLFGSDVLGRDIFCRVFHGLQNIMGTVISQIMVSIPTIIFMESALSLMGLGLSSGEISLGMLIQGGLQTFFLHPHKLVPAIIVMVLTMISCNRLADGIRYALDPNEIA